jgi:hypothetical protein
VACARYPRPHCIHAKLAYSTQTREKVQHASGWCYDEMGLPLTLYIPKPKRGHGSINMSIVLLVCYLAQETVHAMPLLHINQSTSESSCYDIRNCRTLSQIIFSCLSTIFASTWVALHPNVPDVGDSEQGVRVALQRARLFVVMLFAPELVIGWAARQWFVSRSLAKKYHGVVTVS